MGTTSKPQVTFSRLRAVTRNLIYIATSPDDHEIGTPFTAICQYDSGAWSYDVVDFELADMTLFQAPGRAYRVLYLLSETGIVTDFSTKTRELLLPANSPLRRGHRLGYMLKIRNIGGLLFASGDGGQVYRRNSRNTWENIDPNLLDGPDLSIEILRDLKKIEHPNDKDYDEHKERQNKNISNTLWSLSGLSGSDLYVCSEKGLVYHFDGARFHQVAADDADERPLLDVLAETPEQVWACGREGALLMGNYSAGFREVPVEGWPDFNGMTRFRDKLYLSSYAGPRGLFAYDGRRVERVRSGLKPDIEDVTAVESVDGVLWVMGRKDLLRFDGASWERIDFPGNDPIR